MMKYIHNNYLLVLFFTTLVVCNVVAQTKVAIVNKSFEDIPRQGVNTSRFSVNGWFDCGAIRFPYETPPDIHPGNFWENNTPPSDGRTYVGMVVRDNETQESIAQRLSAPLKVGKCYKFTIDLSRSEKYISQSRTTTKTQNYNTPAVLRIWGGNGNCDEKQLLGESAGVNHADWRTYQFKVKPNAAFTHIMLEAYYKTPVIIPYSGHILLDNLSDFDEMDCQEVLPPVVSKNSAIAAKVDKPKTGGLPPHKQGRVDQAKDTTKPPVATNNTGAVVSKQEVEKPKILKELDINTIKPGTTIEIKTLNFKADESTIDMSSYAVLDEIYTFLKQHTNIKVEIGGHTNGIPDHAYCDKLSSNRAKAVHDYLINKGLPNERISHLGYGKRRRVASDATVEGRQKNQRVEIKVLSLS
jgi:outer membrane protein OmpA-like peptidoglycan-associated protein